MPGSLINMPEDREEPSIGQSKVKIGVEMTIPQVVSNFPDRKYQLKLVATHILHDGHFAPTPHILRKL